MAAQQCQRTTERGDEDGYLRLSSSQPLHFFERDANLIEYASTQVTYPIRICAIDAEWPPSTSAASTQSNGNGRREEKEQQAASLAQLAIRDDTGRNHVLVVDLYAVSKACIKEYIISMFHDSSIVKVGYGLWADVKAILLLASKTPDEDSSDSGGDGGAGGDDGGREERRALTSSDVWKCDEWVDLCVLHGKAINPRGTCLGLKDLTSCLLGCSMRKELQCSAWGERPLSRAQLEYAALDAACLLDMFDKVVNRLVLKTHLNKANANGSQEKKLVASALEYARELAVIQKTKKKNKGRSNQNQNQSNNGKKTTKAKTREKEKERRKRRQQKDKGKEGEKEVVGDGMGAWNDSDRDDKASIESMKASVSGWLCTDEKPKFICDEMLEGLAKQLRSLGIDADSVTSNKHKALLARTKKMLAEEEKGVYWKLVRETQRHIRELLAKEMVEKHDMEGRVVLTADRKFANRRLVDRVLFIRPRGKREQLKHVIEIFQLDIQDDNLFTRCIKCNGEFQRIPRKVVSGAVKLKSWQDEEAKKMAEREDEEMLKVVPTFLDLFGFGGRKHPCYPKLGLTSSEELICDGIMDQVPRNLIEKQLEFWQCVGCNKIYWEGVRYETALSCLKTQLTDCKIK